MALRTVGHPPPFHLQIAVISAVETNLAAARKQTSPATGLDGLIAPPKH